jgi:hypothetical protein
MAKNALARNQAFLDKVIKENERLVLVCATMKQKLSEAQDALSRCKAETLREMEPKLQKLLDDHQINMKNQAFQLEQDLRDASSPFHSDCERMKVENDKQILQIESECRVRLQSMKSAALAEEERMKTDLAQKLASLPAETERLKSLRKAQLDTERIAWQEFRASELRQHLESRYQGEIKRSTEKRNKLLSEVREKLTAEAREENHALADEFTRNKKSHSVIEQELLSAIRSRESEIKEIRTVGSDMRLERDKLATQLRNCECRKLRLQLDERTQALMDLQTQLDCEKATRIGSEADIAVRRAGLLSEIEKIDRENAALRSEIDRVRKEGASHEIQFKDELEHMEERHRRELEMIGARVRQTVEKKDAVIQQLMDRLESIGNTSADF